MLKFPASAAGTALRNFIRTLQGSAYSLPGPIDNTEPTSDPYQKTKYTLYSTHHNYPTLVEGVITDFTNVAYAYRVKTFGLKVPMVCYAAADSAFGFFGARKLNTYTPGTRVLVSTHPQQRHGWIVCTLPAFDSAVSPVGYQQLLGSSRKRADFAHSRPLQASNQNADGARAKVKIASNTAGRLLDATSAGEVGYITETGMRFFLDSFMAMLGCDEATGLTFFHGDQLARLAAYNYQFWTAGCEHEALDDQSEYIDWIGYTPYPWEQLGLIAPPTAPSESSAGYRVLEDAVWTGTTKGQETGGEPWNFKREPQDTHQMPWHRFREFRGYLGQGYKRVIQGPPQNSQQTFTKYSSTDSREPNVKHPLFYSETVLLDGTWLVESAKQISIIKRVGGVSPVRTHRPEQTTASGAKAGDDVTNYKFAGLNGDGPAHKISSGYTAPSIQQQVAAIYDLHGYLHNYAGIHAFFWHRNDWYVPEMSEMDYLNEKALDYSHLQFNKLLQQQNLDEPSKVELYVDHRYKKQRYYQTEAGITFMEDGSVVLFDGYGSSLTMSQGQIYIDAAADIFMRAGRNVNAWAGNDVNVRAKDSVDLVASTKDVRIKAEKNLQVLGGNSGRGGVLIESRGAGRQYEFQEEGENATTTGIMLRAGKSDVVSYSQNVYLRTGGVENLITQNRNADSGYIAPGSIVLDAYRGKSSVISHARGVYEFLTASHDIYFGEQSSITHASSFTPDNTLLAGFLRVEKGIYSGGLLWTDGPILAGKGQVVAAEGCNIGKMDNDTKQKVEAAAEEIRESIRQDVSNGSTRYFSQVEQIFYADTQAGSDATIRGAQFAFRTIQDYGMPDFKLFETRWQQLAREADYNLPKWQERAVSTANGDSYPFPGNFTASNFYQQPLQLYNSGNYKDRALQDGQLSEAYSNGTIQQPQQASLNDYTVTGSNTQ
jgi:hypothetical protein